MFKNVIKEQLKVPAHFDYLGELRDFVTRVGHKHGVSDKVINAFKLAIDEAGTNIIRHAYRDQDEPGYVLLRVVLRKASATVSLIDQGKYFDPRGVRDPDLRRYVDIGKKGGLGIFIIRKLMDDIDYRRTEEGNELRLTKNLEENKGKGVKAISDKIGSVPLSLKAKYFIRTALIITLTVISVYGYFYFKEGNKLEKAYFTQLGDLTSFTINSLTAKKDIFDQYNPTSIATVKNVIHSVYQENENVLYSIFLVDSTNFVVQSSDSTIWLQTMPAMPNDRLLIRENLYLYTIDAKTANSKVVPVTIYDYFRPVFDPRTDTQFGELHVRMRKSLIDGAIGKQRWEDARLALSILLLSYVGALLLIYVLLNPFRKLSDWVRALDHGEVQDEMDIDSSTEIGEIAKAFSEITTKFRESQKNLAEQERLQKEMQVAQEIQQTLLPTEFPDIEGYEIASYYEAAKEVGGDYFDFVEVDKDTLGIVVADVSGKGVPGSLVMTMIRTALRTEARGVKDAAEVLARVNDFVVGDMKKGMFVTIFYVIIDSKRRRLNYASAGHNPMILFRPSTQKTYYLNPKGFPIGIQLAEKDLFRKSIESDTIRLAEDDILLLYTDGITEAMNGKRDLFGEERLLKVMREYGHLRVKPFAEQLQLEMQSFTAGNVQYDDITLVSIKEKTTPEKEELRRAKLAHNMIAEGKSIREACETAGITTYAYYNKYKKHFEEHGVENYEVDDDVSVEAKHISIEDKTKVFDIIKNHPEYGAKRISEELNTEKYGFTNISESKIYDELVRSRLNTRQLREAFVVRGGRNRRQMKPPGTPMLTLDGKIIIDRKAQEHLFARQPSEVDVDRSKTRHREDVRPSIEIKQRPTIATTRRVDRDEVDMDAISTPIEELLDKSNTFSAIGTEEKATQDAQDKPGVPDEIKEDSKQEERDRSDDLEFSETAYEDKTLSFADLFAGGSILDDLTQDGSEVQSVSPSGTAEKAGGTSSEETHDAQTPAEQSGGDKDITRQASLDDEYYDLSMFGASDDLLRKEIRNSFEEMSSNVVADENSADVASPDSGVDGSHNEHRQDFEELDQLLNAAKANGTSDGEVPIMGDDTLEIVAGVGRDANKKVDDTEKNDQQVNGVDKEAVGKLQSEIEGLSFSGDKAPSDTQSSLDETDVFLELFADADGETASRNAFLDHAAPKKKSSDHKQSSTTLRPAVKKDEKRPANAENLDREQFLIDGLRYYKKQEFDKAIDKFKKAVELYPDFKEAHSILGNAYFRKNLYKEAAKSYMKVLQIDPKDTTAHENMGVIYANQGHLEKAVEQWKNVLRIDPNRQDILKKIEKAIDLLEEKTVASR